MAETQVREFNGAKCILRVCLDPVNLELLANHESLLGVLSRELRENYKKSHDLATAISCIFLCFAQPTTKIRCRFSCQPRIK